MVVVVVSVVVQMLNVQLTTWVVTILTVQAACEASGSMAKPNVSTATPSLRTSRIPLLSEGAAVR